MIGYGGGDGSLMSFLEKDRHLTKLYWCFRRGDWPDERVEALVQRKNGFLVEIDGFDAFMLKLGNQRFPVAVTPTETEKLLYALSKRWADNYQEQYNILKDNPAAKQAAVRVEQAEERREAAREQENALSAWDYFRRGNRAFEEGDNIKAIANYGQAIRLNPDYAEAYFNRGVAWNNLGEYQKAIADYNEAIRLKPDYSEAYNNRGVAWDNLGEYQKAMDDCNESIHLKPDNAEAYDSRGTVWHHLGKHQKAIDDYSEAIRLNPKLKLTYQNRAKAYRAIGRDDLADQDEAAAASLSDEP